ncbi:MAG: hypothetical protein V4572_00940 [Bacteroidota bacterium]
MKILSSIGNPGGGGGFFAPGVGGVGIAETFITPSRVITKIKKFLKIFFILTTMK